MKFKLLLLSIAVALTGCGAIGNTVLTDNALKNKASIGLNTNPENISISNRRSDGLDSVRFTATVNGKAHQCYVTTLAGAISSDAVCSSGESSVTSSSNSGQQCNALLKAAGRC